MCVCIKRSLPRLEEQILRKLAETQVEIDRYGIGPPTEPEQKIYFLTNVSDPNEQCKINHVQKLKSKLTLLMHRLHVIPNATQ